MTKNCANTYQLFRLWLGIAEYLYRNEELLNESIDNAITDNTHVADDLEFTFAARVSHIFLMHRQGKTLSLTLIATGLVQPRLAWQSRRLPYKVRTHPELLQPSLRRGYEGRQ